MEPDLGHEDVLTALSSYATVPEQRQEELIKSLARRDVPSVDDLAAKLAAVVHREFARR